MRRISLLWSLGLSIDGGQRGEVTSFNQSWYVFQAEVLNRGRRARNRFFEHPSVAPLKLRYFDPTLSYVDDRIRKGLIESLMLQRAAVTIYNAGSQDTMGKDSELAATLAQGKPVIVYVPENRSLDGRAETFRVSHPLGLQIDHDTGVAHGIVVVRRPEDCATMLRSILIRDLALAIRHVGGNHLLEESGTGSVLRVVSDDPLLTHAFWTYFRRETVPLAGKPTRKPTTKS